MNDLTVLPLLLALLTGVGIGFIGGAVMVAIHQIDAAELHPEDIPSEPTEAPVVP
jgi:hypothetical protein